MDMDLIDIKEDFPTKGLGDVPNGEGETTPPPLFGGGV